MIIQVARHSQFEVTKLAALLHRAADMTNPPTMKETKFLLPKPALTQRDIKPAQWVQMVQTEWNQIEMLHSIQAKAQFLGESNYSNFFRKMIKTLYLLTNVSFPEILSKWPLFGSSFFGVKRGGDQQILSLNRYGVHFLHFLTHVSGM